MRLDSWKSIAQYLGRSPRTVQRWHSGYSMPVYHVGGQAGSVFVYTHVLDDWLRTRSQIQRDDPPEYGGSVPGEKPLSQSKQVHGDAPLSCDVIPGLQTFNSQDLVAHADRMWQCHSSSSLGAIAQIYRRAADLDPANAQAYAGLSQTLIAEGFLGCVHSTTAYNYAKAALRRAIEIDPELFKAKCSTAWLKMVIERDWEGARQGFTEILNQHPDYSQALIGRALLYLAEGRHPEALDLLQKVSELYPLQTPAVTLLSWCKYLAGEYEQALACNILARLVGHTSSLLDAVQMLISIQLEGPGSCIPRMKALTADCSYYSVPQGILGYAYGMTGQEQKGREVFSSFIDDGARVKPHHTYSIALTLIGLNERQTAMEWLERSYRYGSLWSLGFLSDPILAPLRSDPSSYELFLSKLSYPAPENSDG
jgi:tetratricopeptide (TPR) repeat protein